MLTAMRANSRAQLLGDQQYAVWHNETVCGYAQRWDFKQWLRGYVGMLASAPPCGTPSLALDGCLQCLILCPYVRASCVQAFLQTFLQAGARGSLGEDRYGERPERLGGLGSRGSEDFGGPSRSSVDERDRDRLVPKGRGFGYGRGRGAGAAGFLQVVQPFHAVQPSPASRLCL
jgi:hypothetical protein